MAFWTYLLQCADGSYCAGHTDNLEQRRGAHPAGTLRGQNAKRRPIVLPWSPEFAPREEVLAAVRQTKGWNRARKEAPIHGDWKDVQRLARGTKNPLPERLRQIAPFDTSGRTGFMETTHAFLRIDLRRVGHHLFHSLTTLHRSP